MDIGAGELKLIDPVQDVFPGDLEVKIDVVHTYERDT